MLRRHFFLAGALCILLLMLVAAGLKLTLGKGRMEAAGGGAAGAQASGGRRGGAGPVQITATQVTSRDFTNEIEVIGTAKGRQSVTLTAATTQLVQRVRFRDGQSVPRGAVLVELKNTEQDAGVEQAQARLLQARRAYDRYKTLNQQGYASKAAMDQYEAGWRSAQADVSAAQARQNDRTIRAPFAGVVGLSDVAPGALVNPGAPIVTLDDLSAVRVDFQVPERYLSALSEGEPISAKVDAYPGMVIRGRIAKLDTRIDERTRSITARAEFPNPNRQLKPGMMIRIAIAHGSRHSAAAPESAVQVEGDSAFLFVLRQDGQKLTTEQRPVITGLRQDGFVEITEGAKAGERMVADGLNKIQAGQPVKLTKHPGGIPQPDPRPRK